MSLYPKLFYLFQQLRCVLLTFLIGVIVSALGLLAHAAVKINESVTANKSAHFHLLLNAIFIFLFIPFTN